MPGFIGIPELLILGVVILLVFGPKRLPEIARSLGKGMRELKSSIGGDQHEDEVRPELLAVPTEPETVVDGSDRDAVPAAAVRIVGVPETRLRGQLAPERRDGRGDGPLPEAVASRAGVEEDTGDKAVAGLVA